MKTIWWPGSKKPIISQKRVRCALICLLQRYPCIRWGTRHTWDSLSRTWNLGSRPRSVVWERCLGTLHSQCRSGTSSLVTSLLVQTPGHVVSTALLRKGPAPLGFLMGTSIGMMKTAEIPTQKEVSIQMEVMAAVTPEWTTAVAMMDLDPLPSVFQLQLPLSSIPTAPPGANRYGKIRYCKIRTIPICYRGI